MTGIACAGVLVADIVAGPLARMPEKGKMTKVQSVQLSIGGCAANTALVLNRLGMRTSLYAKVGNDELGRFLLSSLREHGVGTSGIRFDDKSGTGCSIVLSEPDGERSFITMLGANTTMNLNDIDWQSMKRNRLIHVGGALLLPKLDGKPTAELFKRAREHRITTCLDTAWDESGLWWKAIADCLGYTDLFLPSLVEAEKLTGKTDIREMARCFLDAGVQVVGIKLGERGSRVYTKKQEFHIPRFDVQSVDCNGAGDAYVAGFIAGWVNELPLEETARLANAVGALSTMDKGPIGCVGKLNDVLSVIRDKGYLVKSKQTKGV